MAISNHVNGPSLTVPPSWDLIKGDWKNSLVMNISKSIQQYNLTLDKICHGILFLTIICSGCSSVVCGGSMAIIMSCERPSPRHFLIQGNIFFHLKERELQLSSKIRHRM